MKPKIFIGSSVEGLNVAYSIQANLTHDAEVTVWDQGVFELSKSTIESLSEILEKSDFGIFVFSPDDIVKIRDISDSSVRDNVLFEFGLFIGKLGRERVFFIIPNDTKLHLPTDLIGITPGKYEPNREDGSLQAATGSVCHQIRSLTKKLGRTTSFQETTISPELKDTVENIENEWINDFISKNYKGSIKKLNNLLQTETDNNEKLVIIGWKAYCSFKINENKGIKELESIIKNNSDNIIAHRNVAQVYYWEDYLDKAIEILTPAITQFNNENSLVLLLSECYLKEEGSEKALSFLSDYEPEKDPDIAINIANILETNSDYEGARKIIHKTYLNFPNNEKIKYKYARIALELNENEIALYFLKSLTDEFENNSSYWGYLSNCCIVFNLYDMAMTACKKAEDLTKSKKEWIISNIGNMLIIKGFFYEAIKYLEKGIELDKSSDYAHDRLSTAIKSRNSEINKMNEIGLEGRKLLRNYKIK